MCSGCEYRDYISLAATNNKNCSIRHNPASVANASPRAGKWALGVNLVKPRSFEWFSYASILTSKENDCFFGYAFSPDERKANPVHDGRGQLLAITKTHRKGTITSSMMMTSVIKSRNCRSHRNLAQRSQRTIQSIGKRVMGASQRVKIWPSLHGRWLDTESVTVQLL
jgi:hypothetical protein